MSLRFTRFEKLVGEEALTNFCSKKVFIVGCGGVGGYVCEALARSGVGTLALADFDTIDESNLNRQIIALNSTVGKKKVDILKKRILDINPNCQVISIDQFIDGENFESFLSEAFDYVVDACDTITTKKVIIDTCSEQNIPFISCMGTGNKFDPSLLEITRIGKTVNDPLARILRKYVKDQRIKTPVMVLSSSELPIKTGDRTPGSTAFVPSSAGLLIASYIIREWLKEKR